MTSSFDAERELTLSTLSRAVQSFAKDRSWEEFHDPKNLSMALASEVGELVALLRWVSNAEADAALESGAKRDALESEIGDVGICLFLLCARARIDLGSAILEKLRRNASKYPIETSRGHADPPVDANR